MGTDGGPFFVALGFIAGVAAVWFVLARVEALLDKQLKKLQRQQQERGVRPVARTDKHFDLLQFLYTQRLTLLNVRREHEWKVYFAAMVLLGAGDAALLSRRVIPDGLRSWWALACGIVVLLYLDFESGLQKRNALDREAMDTLYNWLCDELGIPSLSPARERLADRARFSWPWPARSKVLLLLLAGAVSASLPFIHSGPADESGARAAYSRRNVFITTGQTSGPSVIAPVVTLTARHSLYTPTPNSASPPKSSKRTK